MRTFLFFLFAAILLQGNSCVEAKNSCKPSKLQNPKLAKKKWGKIVQMDKLLQGKKHNWTIAGKSFNRGQINTQMKKKVESFLTHFGVHKFSATRKGLTLSIKQNGNWCEANFPELKKTPFNGKVKTILKRYQLLLRQPVVQPKPRKRSIILDCDANKEWKKILQKIEDTHPPSRLDGARQRQKKEVENCTFLSKIKNSTKWKFCISNAKVFPDRWKYNRCSFYQQWNK